jgi:hypothetical protein
MYYIDKEELEDFIKHSRNEVRNHGFWINVAAAITLIYLLPLLLFYILIYVVVNLPKKIIQKVKHTHEKNN